MPISILCQIIITFKSNYFVKVLNMLLVTSFTPRYSKLLLVYLFDFNHIRACHMLILHVKILIISPYFYSLFRSKIFNQNTAWSRLGFIINLTVSNNCSIVSILFGWKNRFFDKKNIKLYIGNIKKVLSELKIF